MLWQGREFNRVMEQHSVRFPVRLSARPLGNMARAMRIREWEIRFRQTHGACRSKPDLICESGQAKHTGLEVVRLVRAQSPLTPSGICDTSARTWRRATARTAGAGVCPLQKLGPEAEQQTDTEQSIGGGACDEHCLIDHPLILETPP
jgi:hypothetical protein